MSRLSVGRCKPIREENWLPPTDSITRPNYLPRITSHLRLVGPGLTQNHNRKLSCFGVTGCVQRYFDSGGEGNVLPDGVGTSDPTRAGRADIGLPLAQGASYRGSFRRLPDANLFPPAQYIRTGEEMGRYWSDLRFGFRQLRLNPMFTCVAVLSLTLGICANTAIFQLIDAIRLRALPVVNPQELGLLDYAPNSKRSGWWSTSSATFTSVNWESIRKQQEAFSDVIAWSAKQFNLSTEGKARYAEGLFVSGDFFRVLGGRPVVGRVFTAADDHPGCGSPAAVLGYSFWQSEFAGDRAVTSRTVRLDGKTFPIVGVMAPEFFGVEIGQRFEVAVPLCSDPMFWQPGKGRIPSRTAWWLSIMGRLKPGWTVEQANAQIRAASPAIMRESLPAEYRADDAKKFLANKLTVTSGGTGVSQLRRRYQDPLWILFATTGLVLLIACANLANLMLARASVREREIAVRQAIGASRWRLVSQLLSESMLLALLGAGLGAGLAALLSRGLIGFFTTERNRILWGYPWTGGSWVSRQGSPF